MTAGDQFTPIVASLANGGHVVVWESGTVTNTGLTPDTVIHAQMFDATGQKAGSEIVVFNAPGYDGWKRGAVAGLPDGSFIVAASNTVLNRSDPSNPIPEIRLYTQKVDPGGQLVSTGGTSDGSVNGGLANLVAADTIDHVVAIEGERLFVNGNGSYALVVARSSRPVPAITINRQLQNFDTAGHPAGASIALLSGEVSGPWPTTAQLANGNILAAAVSFGTYSPIAWKIVTPGGQVLADQIIGAAPGNAVGAPAVAALADGTAVIVHSYADSMTQGWKAAHIDANGNYLGVVTLPIPSAGTLTALSGGGYLVTWTNVGSNQIVGRYFTSAGQPSGDEFVIASGITTQFVGRPLYRIVAVPGGFIAVYQAAGSEGQEIYEIRFTAPTLG